jgi:peptide/nickel transport system substrate-binding protein
VSILDSVSRKGRSGRDVIRRLTARRQQKNGSPAHLEELDHKLVRSLAKKRWPALDQWRYLSDVLSPRERRLAAAFFAVFLISTVVLAVRFYQRHVVALPKEGGSYTEVIVGSPQYINPVLSAGNDVDQDLVSLLYSSLYRVGSGPTPEPDLVEKTEISEDGKTYTLTLRSNVRWDDGDPLTAEDVVFTFELIQQREFQSPLRNAFRNVTVEKVDDLTIKLMLKDPSGPFLSALTFGILPEHIWRDVPPASIALVEQNLKPIGSGPFKFSKLVRSTAGVVKSYTIVRNDAYYGKLPYLDSLTFRFAPDLESALTMVRENQGQGLSFVPTSDLDRAKKLDRERILSLRLPQLVGVFFNQNVTLLNKKEVRQALGAALDRTAIANVVGQVTVADSPISPDQLGFSADAKMPAYDTARAESLLDAAGWKKVEGEAVRKNGNAKLGFILTTVDQPDYVAVANTMKEQWAKVGAEVTVNVVDPGVAQREVLRPRKYDALLYGEITGLDPDPYPFWHSSQSRDPGLNLSVYYRKDIDTVLEDARKATNPEVRAGKYIEFQRLFSDELPALILYRPDYHYVVDKKLRGMTTSWVVSPRDRFNEVTSWYTRTKRGWK